MKPKVNPPWRTKAAWLALTFALVGAAVVLAPLALARALPVSGPATALRNEAAGAASCGVVSCTAFVPVIVTNDPPPSQLEVTQAVQQPDNSVPLVANRTTFVRYTITSTTAYTSVRAYLYASRGDSVLPGSPLAALNNPRTLPSTASRGTLNDTFNFQLPASWLSGTISLYASATNGSTFNVTGGSQLVQFVSAAPMPVTIVPIAYACSSGGSGTTTPAGPYAYLTDYTYRLYPVPSIVTATHASVSYSGPCNSSGVPKPTQTDWSNMLNQVTTVWQADGAPDSYYYGLVKIDCAGGCISGIGWIGFYKAAVGFDGFGATHSGASETHAHEVGHNHGRSHSPGCGAAGADTAFPYTYADGKARIGNDSHQNYGFDIKPPYAVYPYSTFYDIMNYCNPQWMSDYTYVKLLQYDQLHSLAGLSAPRADRALLVSGSIDPATGLATFRPAFVVNTKPRLPEPGDYTIDLLDAAGHVIAAYPFAPVLAHADRWRDGSAFEQTGFHMNLPYAEGVTSIRVRDRDTIRGTLTAGGRIPLLRSGTSALGADGHSLSVHWSGSDADGDKLIYLVRASIDDGVTWQTIGVDQTTPSMDLRPIDFGGRKVVVEVLASDGLHTASLRLGPFVVLETTN